MKILICYASAGAGHVKAAQAIGDYLLARDAALDIRLVDLLDKSNFLFGRIYAFGYAFLIRHCAFLWGAIFFLSATPIAGSFIRRIIYYFNLANLRNFSKELVRWGPDLVVSTHFLPAEVAASLKKRELIRSRLITVITDFAVHPFWVCDPTDVYIAATSETKRQLIGKNIASGKIKDIGIPVARDFFRPHDKKALIGKLGLKEEFTVLIMTGSFGIGPIEKIVELLHGHVQLIVVCAKNKALFNILSKKQYPQVKVFGFVKNVHELMFCSDLIITKPGGLSISETLAVGLVPLFFNPIPGQEHANVQVLSLFRVGTLLKNTTDIVRIVRDLKDNPQKLAQQLESVKRLKNNNVLEDLYNVIRESSA